MELNKIRVGMKVVPTTKTTGCKMDASCVYRGMTYQKDKFLYVNSITDDGRLVLFTERTTEVEGDYFNPSDVEPYVKKKKSEIDAPETVD